MKHHYFSNASGISYMIQNRRALARVIPQSFQDFTIRSIADAPVDILELLRSLSDHPDPTVVLLSSGPGSAVYSGAQLSSASNGDSAGARRGPPGPQRRRFSQDQCRDLKKSK